MSHRVVDLTHTVRAGMVTYPGLPGPEIVDHMSRETSRQRYDPGTEFQIGRISLVGNTGTYIDAPFHRFSDRHDLADLRLDQLVDLPGHVVSCDERAIGPQDFATLPDDLTGGAVLFRTDWSQHWGTPDYIGPGNPFITADGARELVRRRPALVGIDSVNIDDMEDGSRPAHTLLLQANIPILEHLTELARLPEAGFTVNAPVVPVRGMGTFPVRAFALLDR